MSLGAVIKLIFFYKLESSVLDLQQWSFKKYIKTIEMFCLLGVKKQGLYNYVKVHIALNLLWTIRNRAYHWENLLKIKPNNRPRITTCFSGLRGDDKINTSIEPNKIALFLDDLIKSIGNKDLEKLSSLKRLGFR
ncbi:hypothetical protein JP0057_14880 [Helicobacter pylori]|nr:hypothetical protein JP0057_14880 [Helicobacter pylori]